MKRKLTNIAIMMIMLLTTKMYAQNSDNVTLNIKLYNIQSLIITNGKTVDIEYTQKEHYANGNSTKIEDHISVFSTGAFEVKVKPNDNLINNNNYIEISDIKIIPENGSKSLNLTNLNEITLNKNQETIISSEEGGRDVTFHMTYKAEGEDKYINKINSNENPTIYTTDLLYTITPK